MLSLNVALERIESGDTHRPGSQEDFQAAFRAAHGGASGAQSARGARAEARRRQGGFQRSPEEWMQHIFGPPKDRMSSAERMRTQRLAYIALAVCVVLILAGLGMRNTRVSSLHQVDPRDAPFVSTARGGGASVPPAVPIFPTSRPMDTPPQTHVTPHGGGAPGGALGVPQRSPLMVGPGGDSRGDMWYVQSSSPESGGRV